MTVHDLLSRAEAELSSVAVVGLANAGPTLSGLAALSDDLAAAGLGKLGERLRAVADAADDRARAAAWVAAWTGVGLVRTRLLKPVALNVQDALALPQAPNVFFPRPAGDLDSLDGLLAMLQSPQMLARAYAASRLADLGDAAIPGLLAVQKQCGRCIRFLVVETLARIGSDAALEALVGLLGDGDVARPVEAALLAQGPRCAPLVAEALAGARGKDKKRGRAAAKILWRLGAAQPLESALSDGDEMIKACAQAALWPAERLAQRAQQKGAAALPAAVVLFEQQLLAIDALIEHLDTLPKNQLADAAAILRHTGAEQMLLAHYLPQISAGVNQKARERAATFIALLAHPAALPSLLRLLEGDLLHTPASAHRIADGLAELADSAAVWPLVHIARQLEQESYVRTLLIKALGRIGDPAAVPALLQILDDAPFRALRDAIEQALVAIGAPAVEAIGQRLQQGMGTAPPCPLRPEAAVTLERALKKIKTPAARAALNAYLAGADKMTRWLGHLSDGPVNASLIEEAVELGDAAVDSLLLMLTGDLPDGQVNAAYVLTQLAPSLADEQRERIIAAFRAQLRAQQMISAVGFVGIHDSLVAQLVQALCDLDVSAALSEIRDALVFKGTGQIVIERWQQTRRPWLLEIIAQGIQSAHTRLHALTYLRILPLDEDVHSRLWPLVESIVQTETDAQTLYQAVAVLRAWGDSRAVPLLQALKGRLGSVTGYDWYKNSLREEIDDALADLGRKRSLLRRLLSKG